MKFRNNFVKVLVIAGLCLFGSSSFAEDAKKVDADNTGINERDRKADELTADSQADSGKEDVELTRKIRQALTADDKLSTYAENIKIVTINGVATLKGPVKSMAEKRKVGNHAQKIVGKAKVNNEIEVVKNQ